MGYFKFQFSKGSVGSSTSFHFRAVQAPTAPCRPTPAPAAPTACRRTTARAAPRRAPGWSAARRRRCRAAATGRAAPAWRATAHASAAGGGTGQLAPHSGAHVGDV